MDEKRRKKRQSSEGKDKINTDLTVPSLLLMIPQNQNIGKGYKHEDRAATQRGPQVPISLSQPTQVFQPRKKNGNTNYLFLINPDMNTGTEKS